MALFLIWTQRLPAQEDFYGRQLPKFEGGLALGYFDLPEYPGSDERRQVFLPLPFFIYRGDVIKADRDGGLRGRFLRGREYEMDISIGAAFPSNSEDNQARAGMENLDWIGEVGPRLRFFLVRRPMIRVDLNLPIRHVFSTNFSSRWNARGFVFNPELRFQHRALFMKESSFVARIEATHATKELMDYLYSVESGEATALRPAYDAQAGFFSLGTSVSFVRSLLERKMNVFVGVSKSFFGNAKNEDSPLMKDKDTTSYFLGISYNFFASRHMVEEVIQ